MRFVLLIILFFIIHNGYAYTLAYKDIVSFFSPMPQSMPNSEEDTPARIKLGKALFFETAISVNNTQSCNSCHNVINNSSGVDHLKVSIGALGKLGQRNAPTIWNAGFHIAQFWDGRAKTLEEQARAPILNPNEMAMPSEEAVIIRLKNKNYLADFQRAFPKHKSPINMNTISIALASFQRTFITSDRFDDYLKGNMNAITVAEKKGLNVFISKGCVACHNGSVLGGQIFMKMGLVNPYPNKIDKGKAQATGNPADNFFFKAPSLRNVLNTAPYFHDGAAVTIEQAIEETGWHQLGIRLTKEEVAAIKAFFNTLDNQAKVMETEVVQ